MIPATTLLLFGIAAVLGLLIVRRPGKLHRQALHLALEQIITSLPRVVLALLAAGFLAQLLPGPLIAGYLSSESGLGGILVATVLGVAVPGGGVLAFPLALVLAKAGAGTPQLIAFITSWSVFAAHRALAYEIGIMGWRFYGMRLLACLPLPILAGVAAGLVTHLPF